MRGKIIPQSKVIVSIVLLISLFMINIVQASETEYKELQTTTYRFLQYVKEGQDHAALAALEDLDRFNTNHSINTKISSEEIDALIKQTRVALKNPKSSTEDKYHMALTVVLLYDAIWNEENALWLTWKSYLEEEIDRSLKNKNLSKASIKNIYSLYVRLLPALKVDLEEKEYMIMKNHQEAFVNILEGESQQEYIPFITAFSQDLKKIPVKEEKSFTEEPGFIWLLFSVGGLIISTLMYVGWRKYKGESVKKDEQKERGS